MVDYKKRLVEVDEILNYMSRENLRKIPENIRKEIKNNKDENYTWKFDVSKKLKDQNLNRNTILILSYLNMKYLLNEQQKKFIKNIHILNENKRKLNKKEIFKKQSNDINQYTKIEKTENKNIIIYKEKFFSKIKCFFKKFLKIK